MDPGLCMCVIEATQGISLSLTSHICKMEMVEKLVLPSSLDYRMITRARCESESFL